MVESLLLSSGDYLDSARKRVWEKYRLGDERRNARLGEIIRYKNYPVKHFPTSLKSHQHQVAAMALSMYSVIRNYHQEMEIYSTFNPDLEKLILMAYIHDDHEHYMEMGDWTSANELHVNAAQLQEVYDDEERAIDLAIQEYACTISQDDRNLTAAYAKCLRDSASKLSSIESQFLKLCDKLAGLCEALHEIADGNHTFLEGMYDIQYDTINVSPLEYYEQYFEKVKCIESVLPLAIKVIGVDLWFNQTPLVGSSQLQLRHYNFWMTALCKYAPEWECKRLFGSLQRLSVYDEV